jgi:hypothetical protein
LKKHKPWFDEGCSKLLDQRKQAKLQWLQDPNEINGDNLNNGRRGWLFPDFVMASKLINWANKMALMKETCEERQFPSLHSTEHNISRL